MMTSVPDTTGRVTRWLCILPLTAFVTFCAGRTPVRTPVDQTRIDIRQLWVEPVDLESRDLFHGAGGSRLAPDPSAVYELVKVDNTGFSPGYDVRDREGTVWSVKLGIEAQSEVVASRVLWAVGYHQPATYLLKNWKLSGAQPGTHPTSRFRRNDANQKVVSEWSWYENPFVDTRPFKGLIVANLILNNWDWKTSNNRVYEVGSRDGERRHQYVVRDLGASLGKTSFPKWLVWTPFRAMAQGSRNNLPDFEEQGFIKAVDGQRITFDYYGTHGSLVDMVTVDDVVWMSRLLARLSDRQWHDAFRAAGYDDATRQRFIAKLRSKIRDGSALERTAAR